MWILCVGPWTGDVGGACYETLKDAITRVCNEVRKTPTPKQDDGSYAREHGWGPSPSGLSWTKGLCRIASDSHRGRWEVFDKWSTVVSGEPSLRHAIDFAEQYVGHLDAFHETDAAKPDDDESYAHERGWVWHEENFRLGRVGRWSHGDTFHVFKHGNEWMLRSGSWKRLAHAPPPMGKYKFRTMREAIDAAGVGDTMVRPGDPSFRVDAGKSDRQAEAATSDVEYALSLGWTFCRGPCDYWKRDGMNVFEYSPGHWNVTKGRLGHGSEVVSHSIPSLRHAVEYVEWCHT